MVKTGETITFDATGTSDSDEDQISFRWWQYQEAGTYPGMIKIDHPIGKKISFIAPEVEQSCTIHLILEVKDRGKPALFSFQRMIITVTL
jgi:hypothetical protein